MNLTVELPQDTLIINRSDLKNVLRELVSEIKAEELQDDILTIQDAAEYMKVSVPVIRKMIDDGDLPHFRRGKIIRLNKYDVLNWMSNKFLD